MLDQFLHSIREHPKAVFRHEDDVVGANLVDDVGERATCALALGPARHLRHGPMDITIVNDGESNPH